MRADRFVASLRLPAKQRLAVVICDVEAVEDRQDPADLAADPVVALHIFALKPEQDRGEIPAV